MTQILSPDKHFSFKLNPIMEAVAATECPKCPECPPIPQWQWVNRSDRENWIIGYDPDNIAELTPLEWYKTSSTLLVRVNGEADRNSVFILKCKSLVNGDIYRRIYSTASGEPHDFVILPGELNIDVTTDVWILSVYEGFRRLFNGFSPFVQIFSLEPVAI